MISPNESLGELVHIDRKKKGKIRVENGPFFVRLTYSLSFSFFIVFSLDGSKNGGGRLRYDNFFITPL